MKELDINGFTFLFKKKRLICADPVILDIETSNNHAEKPEELITWISSIQVYFHGYYYLLRRPEELIEFYKSLYDNLDLQQEAPHYMRYIYTFIHNASFDLSYLIPYFREYLPSYAGESQGLIEGNNKILTYEQGSLVFRCSYRLTQMSLEKFTKEMQVEHIKKVGLYDYDKIIYQDTELSENEKIYDRNDVLGLFEALMKHNTMNKDTLASMPLTQTGYVRRDIRRSCKKNKRYRQNYFLKNKLDPELYYAFLKSFSGGYTHNNRFYKGITIKVGDIVDFFDEHIKVQAIGHRDFTSHYPTMLTCYPFPVGKPNLIYDSTSGLRSPIDIDNILSYYPKFYTMSIIRFTFAQIKDKRISMPFMQYSKCHESTFCTLLQDNGRIISASGSWIMFLDNLTLKILNEQYDLKYDIIKVWKMKADYLPEELTNVVNKYFKGKSDKKILAEDLELQYGRTDPRCFEAQFDLMTNKKMLNSIYGCCATNPLRTTFRIDSDNHYQLDKYYTSMDDMKVGLEQFYDNKNNYLAYQIGCTVTALARYELYEFIKAIGYKKVLYCDTDSAFYIKDAKTEKAIERLNDEKHKKAKYVTLNNGQLSYYDNFKAEQDCKAFRGLHSKCYGVVTEHGLELTIAGVPAKTLIGLDEDGKPVYLTREQELQGNIKDPVKALDLLTNDYTFHVNTGITACYIGAVGGIDGIRKPTILNINGHEISTAGGCVLKRLSEKKVKDTEFDYGYEFLDINLYR